MLYFLYYDCPWVVLLSGKKASVLRFRWELWGQGRSEGIRQRGAGFDSGNIQKTGIKRVHPPFCLLDIFFPLQGHGVEDIFIFFKKIIIWKHSPTHYED